MPKDNEVDENVMPVAWQWLDTSNFRKSIPSAAIREHWNPLYPAATVAELRADRDSWREQAEDRLREWDKLRAEVERLREQVSYEFSERELATKQRDDAWERESSLKQKADAAERRLSEVREIQRTHYGDGIGLHVAMILWTRDYDALTGADPT